ncbi:MAG: hypothetical protein ACRDK9_08760 [Solirubrobacterales bacterium]
MADVERLLSDYIAEHRKGGEANPLEYLDRLEDTERAELAELIDEYLARSPGRDWDAEAYQGSAAELLTDRLVRSFGGAAGLWPVILPRLRERARVMRADIARRLAESLGVSGREEKVEGYYHEMEQGLLPAEGVDPKVLDRLAEILDTSADFLRRAGRSLGEGAAGGEPSTAFTRLSIADREALADADRAAPSAAERLSEPGDAEWDEVDELFRGGPG